ncbi:glycosyltransferase [Clostridium sp. CX1]|uniref:glycosyltransferase n=1 Tax=Clostridium sp. CX1 TaxID=2978346 RepID=UPI0021C1EB66|nr:glycosyltransferase [Clostridium sp. CX1]MCT8975970.1 glycosyltransferase [Clostridium sp. CX1]
MYGYYLNYDGVECSVYESQVLTLYKLLKKSMDIKLINFNRSEGFNKNFKDKCTDSDIYSIIKNKKYDFIIDKNHIESVKSIIQNERKKDDKIILHCRGIYGSYIGIKIKQQLEQYNIKVIADFRGATIEEYKLRFEDTGIIKKLMIYNLIIFIRHIEKFVYRNSDFVLCVSNKLKQYLFDNYGAKKDIFVIPTCLDINRGNFCLQDRARIREQYKLEDKFVFVYCGGGQKWQCPDKVVHEFSILKRYISNAYLLILTKDNEVFQKYLSDINSEDYLILSVSHSDVSKYLSGCDCAFLIRENNMTNTVASPTKFAEYLNCSLPVIVSRGIGDIDYIIDKYKVGIYLTDFDSNVKSKIINVVKENFKTAISKYYSWDKNIKKILIIYNNIFNI